MNKDNEIEEMLIKILQNQNDIKELLDIKNNSRLSYQFLIDLNKVFKLISPEHEEQLIKHLAPYIIGFLTACNDDYMKKIMFLMKNIKY